MRTSLPKRWQSTLPVLVSTNGAAPPQLVMLRRTTSSAAVLRALTRCLNAIPEASEGKPRVRPLDWWQVWWNAWVVYKDAWPRQKVGHHQVTSTHFREAFPSSVPFPISLLRFRSHFISSSAVNFLCIAFDLTTSTSPPIFKNRVNGSRRLQLSTQSHRHTISSHHRGTCSFHRNNGPRRIQLKPSKPPTRHHERHERLSSQSRDASSNSKHPRNPPSRWPAAEDTTKQAPTPTRLHHVRTRRIQLGPLDHQHDGHMRRTGSPPPTAITIPAHPSSP
jgi:hypothetical protein